MVSCLRLTLLLFLFRSPQLVSGFTKILVASTIFHYGQQQQQQTVSRQKKDDSDSLLSSMDFSSTLAWERFYQDQQQDDSSIEWHSSIPFEDIIHFCRPNKQGVSPLSRVLCIGCGDSRLPDAFLNDDNDVSCELTMLDSSPTCIAKLEHRYGEKENISCICGSVMELQTLVMKTAESPSFDVIIDKGLMDALLCGEGWNGPVQTLMEQAQCVLAASNGTYVLVSYTLPPSTREFLQLVTPSWEWTFGHVTTSRSMISTATAVAS